MTVEDRRRMDDDKWSKIFEKLEDIKNEQTAQKKDIEHINKTLFVNNGETCVITSLKELNKNIEELKTKRLVTVSTAQAVWAIILGFLSVSGMALALLETLKRLGVVS